MTIAELYAHLCEAGYGALLRRDATSIGLLDFDIEQDGAIIRVCEKDRGRIVHLYLETGDEMAACAFYLDRVSRQFLHLIGASDAGQINLLQARLEAAGIVSARTELPEYLGLHDTRYRLSVAGSDLKRAQELIGL